MTPSGIEPATFWLLTQCLNQPRHQQRAPMKNPYKKLFFQMLEDIAVGLPHLRI
jgi:hypothetical protein